MVENTSDVKCMSYVVVASLRRGLHRWRCASFSMKLFAILASGLLLSLAASAAQAAPQTLTEAQARAVLDPWYSQFTVATRGDVRAIEEKVVFKTCNGSLPGGAGVGKTASGSSRAWVWPFQI